MTFLGSTQDTLKSNPLGWGPGNCAFESTLDGFKFEQHLLGQSRTSSGLWSDSLYKNMNKRNAKYGLELLKI